MLFTLAVRSQLIENIVIIIFISLWPSSVRFIRRRFYAAYFGIQLEGIETIKYYTSKLRNRIFSSENLNVRRKLFETVCFRYFPFFSCVGNISSFIHFINLSTMDAMKMSLSVSINVPTLASKIRLDFSKIKQQHKKHLL